MSVHGISHSYNSPFITRQQPAQRFSALLEQAPAQSIDPRLKVSEGLTGCFCRIWNLFVDAIKSCLRWFGLMTDDAVQQGRHPVQDEAQVRARLDRQMQCGLRQMNAEPPKPFQYQTAPSTWEMHDERVGNYSVGIAHAQGRRPTMEDEHLATSFYLTIGGRQYPIHLFGIFDGHGGREAARFVRNNLQSKLQTTLTECNPLALSDAGIWNALKRTTEELSYQFKHQYEEIAKSQGTTATISMILDQKLWTANVGDARTVLDNCGIPIQLTEDAKPGDPRYQRGIQKRGGFVQARDVPRVNGILAVARAIGDHALNGAINARPKITIKPLSQLQPGSHLILCCDGIYDVARTQDVVQAVHTHRHASAGSLARNIIYSAYASGSTDNLSAMVVKL